MKYCPKCHSELREFRVRHTYYICNNIDCNQIYAKKGEPHYYKVEEIEE